MTALSSAKGLTINLFSVSKDLILIVSFCNLHVYLGKKRKQNQRTHNCRNPNNRQEAKMIKKQANKNRAVIVGVV